ncbi:MAG: oligosaccharide flippase family protein [Bacteroidia bacterium]|nr:oligosaccharide flippase family protein [Bacteroidia bacterium]
MKPLKDLAGQTVVYGLPSIVGRFLSYLLVPLYTYTFATADYGKITYIYAYISFINIVLTYGMETSLFNFSRFEDNKKRVYSTILLSVSASSAVFFVLFYLLRQSIADAALIGDHPEYISWLALILCSDAVSAIVFAKLRQMNKARTFAVIKTLNILIYIAGNLFFILLCPALYKNPDGFFYPFIHAIYNPAIGIGYILISNVAASLLTLLMLAPYMSLAGFGFDSKLWRRIMPYAMPLVFAGLAGMVNETLDRVLLQYLLPADVRWQQGGIYSACYKLSIIITMFVQAFKYAAEPYFFANAHEKDFLKTYADIVKYFILGCLLISLGTLLNLPWLKHFVGPAYWSGLKVVPILLLANICLGVFYTLSIWYKLIHKTMYGAWLTFFGAAITIILNLYWIPKIGYMGSAYATLICYAACMIACYLWSRKYFPVKFDLMRIGIYFALALIVYYTAKGFTFGSETLMLLANNLLIVLFIAIVFFIERPVFVLPKEIK